jgi:serine protease AprX
MLRRITASLILLGILIAYLTPLAAQAAPAPKKDSPKQNSKLAPEFNSAASSNASVRVIIQTNGRPSAAQDSAVASKGGTRGRSFEALDAITAVVPQSSLAELAARDDVAYISPDRSVKSELAVTRETTGAALAQAGLQGIPGTTGKGVGIAIIDSGISASHPDFQKNGKSRIVAAVNFTNGSAGDGDGHGTGVASVVAGNGNGSHGYAGSYVGIAPDANLIDLKVLDANGTGTTSATMDAINWAIVNQKRYNVRVINMSLGTPVRESFRTDPLCLAVERAVLAGIVVVAAAGNDGHTDQIIGYKADNTPIYRPVYGGIHSPGNSPYAITVGASSANGTVKRSDDTMAQFSSKGPTQVDHIVKPDLVAPGRGVVAAMSQENPYTAAQRPDRVAQPVAANSPQNLYYSYYGTSFSAPVVSGTVALMLEANNSLTPTLVKAALLRTANALPGSLFKSRATSILTQGAGQVNAAAAVELARAFVPNADKLRAGQKVFRPNTSLSSLIHPLQIGGESVAASTQVIYSNGVFFRNNPVMVNGIMLSDGIMLGDGILMGGDGILMGGDGILMGGDGIMLSDGHLLSDGILMGGDGILLTDGILMGGDGILMGGDGILMGGDGILMGGDGILMGGDGILMGDGHVMSDTLRLGADGIVLTDGILMGGDGILMGGDGILMGGDGILMGGDGILMGGDGILMSGDGILLSDAL